VAKTKHCRRNTRTLRQGPCKWRDLFSYCETRSLRETRSCHLTSSARQFSLSKYHTSVMRLLPVWSCIANVSNGSYLCRLSIAASSSTSCYTKIIVCISNNEETLTKALPTGSISSIASMYTPSSFHIYFDHSPGNICARLLLNLLSFFMPWVSYLDITPSYHS
jgi:hypothetical protein